MVPQLYVGYPQLGFFSTTTGSRASKSGDSNRAFSLLNLIESMFQWEFQEPIHWRYLPYIRPIVQAYVREYPHKIWPYMVQYLHFRILKFPLNISIPMFGMLLYV